MRRERLDDPETLERYLRNELSPKDEAEFEAHYLANPDLLDELEISLKLREGFKDIATVDARREASPRRRGPLSWLATPQYAAAATVLLVLSVAVSALLYQRVDTLSTAGVDPGPDARTGLTVDELSDFYLQALDRPGSMMSRFSDTRIIQLLAVRGAGGAGPTIQTTAAEQLVFLLDPGPDNYPSFRATMSRSDAAEVPVWQQDGMQPHYLGMLALAVPAARLEAGDYVVRVEGAVEMPTGDVEHVLVGELAFTIAADP